MKFEQTEKKLLYFSYVDVKFVMVNVYSYLVNLNSNFESVIDLHFIREFETHCHIPLHDVYPFLDVTVR